MVLPPNIYNPYILIELYEEYIKYYKTSDLFRESFSNFNNFLIAHKKHKRKNIIYLHKIRHESRKYHILYD